MKYKIQLSMYGSVAERADIQIEADSMNDAEAKALKMCENCKVKFTNNQESVDGWTYQTENIEEIKE